MHLRRRPALDDPTVAQYRDAIGDRQRILPIARRIDHRPVLGPQTEAMQIAHKRAPGSGVRERWVVDEVVNKEQRPVGVNFSCPLD